MKKTNMRSKYNSELVSVASILRNNMTKEERRLWYDYLKTYPERFSRQKILGNYIADFYCARAKLVIELDGPQHYTKEGREKDEERTAFLNRYDLTVIRIQNSEINCNFNGVCRYIDHAVKEAITSTTD